jgi:hypothetical protein
MGGLVAVSSCMRCAAAVTNPPATAFRCNPAELEAQYRIPLVAHVVESEKTPINASLVAG